MDKLPCIYCDELVDLDEDPDAYINEEIICEECRVGLDDEAQTIGPDDDSDSLEQSGEDALPKL
jgi:hypothetical protein